MPKKRVIAGIFVRDGVAVQSLGFAEYLPIGRPEICARFLSEWGADEILLADIRARRDGRTIDPELVRRVASRCYVPLAVGGGLGTIEDMRRVLRSGADKVVVNSLAALDPTALQAAATVFGHQCIVVSVDARRAEGGGHRAFAVSGTHPTGDSPAELARRAAAAGAGEILVHSIDRDGARTGYDLELVDQVCAAVDVPVIVLGGAGHPAHLLEALRRPGVSAAAAGNLFHYTEHAVAVSKAFLRQSGMDVRTDGPARYGEFQFDGANGRLAKRPDGELEEQLFEFLPPEVI